LDKEKTDALKKLQEKPSMNWRQVLLILAVAWLVFSFFLRGTGANIMPISYTRFKQEIRRGNVTKVTLEDHRVNGTYREPVEGETVQGLFGESTPEFKKFKTVVPTNEDSDLMPLLEEQEVTIHAEQDERSWFWTVLVSFLP